MELLKVMVAINMSLTLILVAMVMEERYGVFQAFAFVIFVMISLAVFFVYRVIRKALDQ